MSDRNDSSLAAALRRVQDLLSQGDVKGALALLETRRASDPWIQNARAVCWMRTGRRRDAMEALRALAYHEGTFAIRESAPPAFAANFAWTLLLEGNLRGAVIALDERDAEGDPSVARLRAVLARWRGSLTRWERFQYWLYKTAARPVELDGAPGDVVLPEDVAPLRAA